jgi:hypothetical protein
MRLYNSQLFNMPYEMLATALATPNENPFVQVPQPSAFPLNLSNTSIFPFGGYPAVLPVPLLTKTGPLPTVTPVPATGLYPDIQDWGIPYVQNYNFGVQTSLANNWLLEWLTSVRKGASIRDCSHLTRRLLRHSAGRTRQEVWVDRSSPASPI